MNWDPFLKEARLLGDVSEVTKGVRAWCVSKLGIGMEAEYVFVQKPKVAAVKMTKGPLILKSFSGSWRYIEVDNSKTNIIFRYHFTSRIKVFEPIMQYIFKIQMMKRLFVFKRKFENHEIK